jgi:formylmethanofuran dehydrogenase subunit B
VTWNAATLDLSGADLLVQSLGALVRDVHQAGRCAVLPLGGSDNALGANQACLWQTGFPLRTCLTGDGPRHDPDLYDTRRLIDSGEADALVWISAFRPLSPPPHPLSLPVIALTAPPVPVEATVAIPVGTPGLDHPGDVFRSDGLVAIRLAALRQDGPPAVAEILDRIGRLVGGAPA